MKNYFKKQICLALFIFIGFMNSAVSQTQGELNQEACNNWQVADKKLNETYQKVLKLYGNDKIFIKQFKESQKAWLYFRDSYLASLYPHKERGYYGSVNPMCRCLELKEITLDRVKQLKLWEEGMEEGDVCAGSVRHK